MTAVLYIKSTNKEYVLEFLKNIFGDKALTFDDFKSALEADKTIKLANLADGKYVDKEKFDKKVTELQTANDTIKQLQGEGVDIEKMKQIKSLNSIGNSGF